MKHAKRCATLAVLLTIFGLAAFAGQEATPQQTQPGVARPPELVLLDTDIGDDIDDAFALALALESPELKILGITTTFGDTETRARLVDRYLAAVGRGDIPVAAGVATPSNNLFTQRRYADQWPAWSHQDGVGFLLDQIRSHPGQITLIAIGPLSNVQAAIERDPGTFRKLRRVVIMGGSIDRGYDGRQGELRPAEPEWNIKCDPAGAKALFSSGVPVSMMPLDATQIHLETAEREEIFARGLPLTDQLTLLYHQWIHGSHAETPTLFDPVAVAFSFRPDLCPATPMRIEVDDQGLTRRVNGEPNAQVCLRSDQKAFLELLTSRITGTGPAAERGR
jgi:purine nucleosidase